MTPRGKTLLILALILGFTGAALAQETPGAPAKAAVSATPGPGEAGVTQDAAKKKKKKKKVKKADSGEKAAKTGSKTGPVRVTGRDPYSIYTTGLFQEVYIDDNLNLYRTRQYGGIVPAIEEKRGTNMSAPAEAGEKLMIHRIGFEQRELFSRLFVLGNGLLSPWIYDNFAQAQGNPEVSYQITVELPGAKIPKYNDRRPLVTRAFNSPIDSIEGQPFKGGVRVIITLKREARYLPVQVGRLLYIDVER